MDDEVLAKLEKNLAGEGGDALRMYFRGNPEGVKAWESILSDPTIRKNINNLQKIDDQVAINNTQYDRIKEGFDISPDKQKFIDELQPKKTFHNNPADEVNGPIAESLDQIEELVSTNNPVNNASKKFWWNHEKNVNTYLDEIYGSENVGRQITVDITDQYGTFSVRLDNMVDASGGNKSVFNIVDAKSSINSNLSTESVINIRNTLSTQNQRRLFDALENGTIIQAKPRGQRAIDFFGVDNNNNLPTIIFKKDIDFYVNDFPPTSGYNIYKKRMKL